MDSNYYKYCIVPQCESTTIKTPKKLFIHVPKNDIIRKKWLQLARRDVNLSSASRMYFCEDHFDLPKDMENYMEYHIMGSVSKIQLKPGCMPSKFDCQPDRRKRTICSLERPYDLKKQRMMIIEECLNESIQSSIPSTSGSSSVLQETYADLAMDKEDLQEACKTDKCIQVLLTKKIRSKATQTNIKFVDKAASPFKLLQKSISTSPFKVKHSSKPRPGGSGLSKVSKTLFIEDEHTDSDFSYTPSISHIESSPSTQSLQMKSSSDGSEIVAETHKQKLSDSVQNTVKKIINKPRFYIGVPKNSYFLIDIISNETNIPLQHILLCLKKIRLDSKFQELADDFAMTSSYASKIFLKNVPIIASILRPFIVKINSEFNRKTLPMSFRHKYFYVSCIIDCLEIEVQKPSKAVNQALTWSDYKKANTIKYLISCTPNGLVNYISAGFGGRTTDTAIVEASDFIQSLEKGMCVMADRGFKHVEQYLQRSGVQLVRPPSVTTGAKLTKSEAKQTKQIASLRIHIERVIRRLREFSMLKPHACININFVRILDDIITIACALINLQDSLIK